MGYKGGRKKGSKNLKRKDGKLINKYDIEFSIDEKKRLESLVNSANRKRRRMLKNESELEFFSGGRSQGLTRGESVGRFGSESDFILAKKSKSLNKFSSKKEYNKYIANLEKVVDRGYVDYKVGIYKDNVIKAMEKEGLDTILSRESLAEIKNMSTKDFMKFAQQDEALEIGFVYSFKQKVFRANMIESALQRWNNNVKNGGRLRNNNKRKRR